MTERLDNPEITPVQTIWQILGEIELLAHGGTIDRHSPHERLSIEWLDASGQHRRDITYASDKTGLERLYWPTLTKPDNGGIEESYTLLDDDDVMHGRADNFAGEDDEATTEQMIHELNEALECIKQTPASCAVYGER